MEERSLVGVLRIAKSKAAPAEDETSEAIYRREKASRLADCILHTYKHNREESDKLIKDPEFLQEVKQVLQTTLNEIISNHRPAGDRLVHAYLIHCRVVSSSWFSL